MVKYYKGDLVEYEIFKLVDFYDPILREPTVPMKFDTVEELKRANYLAFSLSETLSELQGLGLSANQVGLKERVCVINMNTEIWVMFNPEIIEQSMIPANYAEGCLSYPGLYLKLNRPDHIKVRFQAVGGQIVEHEFDGLTAVCIQHEIDHLDGKLYTDKVSPIKLDQAKRKVKTNLKKMRRFTEQYLKQQTQQSQQESESKTEPNDQDALKIISLDDVAPKISILPETVQPKKQPEKFVYRTD